MENFIKVNGFVVHQIVFVYILLTSARKEGGIRLTDESGVITSPGYPNGYPNSIAFIWLINTTQSKYVELTFVDFDVEPYKDCSADYVKIRNKKPSHGNYKDVPQIDFHSKDSSVQQSYKGPYCNKKKPPNIVISSSNLMAIVFISDSSVSHRGFKATYRSLDKKACGEVKDKSYDVLMTPGFPWTYPREGECLWLINVQEGKFIRFEFTAFELEFNAQLCMDEIFIWDGKTSASPLLLKDCRFKPPVIYSSSSHLRIKFTSRGYHRKRGFKAFYTTTTTKGCGGNFYSPNGTFTSPNFNIEAGYTYPAYSNCLWTVIAPKDHVISFKFILFDVLAGSRGFCDEDYVQVFDGEDSKTNPIGKYCNIEKPDVLTSTGNYLSMKFLSNARRHGKGFKVQFRTHKTGCKNSLGMEDGRISSYRISASSFFRESAHFRPESARLNGPYTWCSQPQVNNKAVEFIQVDLGGPTRLTGFATQGYMMAGTRQSYYVTRYKIMYSQDDGRYFKNYIGLGNKNSKYKPKVFNGNTDSIGVHRNDLEYPIIARMFRIIPLGYMHGKKRTICTKIEVFGCKLNFGDGSLLQSLDGHILYKGRASSHKFNHWVISPPELYMNSAIYLMSLYFNLDCQKGNLRISDGVQNNSFCGEKAPPPYQIYSGSRQLVVSLETKKGNMEGQGFGFEYFVESLGDGRILRSPRGLLRGIRSRRNFNEFNISKSTWIVLLPKYERVAAKFTRLKLGSSSREKCDEYVTVKDGVFGSSTTLGNFCHGVPTETVITSSNAMRIEFTSKMKPQRPRRDLDTQAITFEIIYTSYSENGNPRASKRVFAMGDGYLKPRAKERGKAFSWQRENHNSHAVLAAFLVTIFWTFLPT